MPPTSLPSPRSPRRRRRTAAVAAAALAAVLVLLAGCGSDDPPGDASTDTTAATTTTVVRTTSLDQVTVEGAPDAEPTVTFEPAYVGTEDAFRVIQAGTGPVVAQGELVTVDYVGVSGADGSVLAGTYGAEPDHFIAGSEGLLPVVTQAVVGQPVGSRVLVATTANDGSGAWNLIVFDIRASVPGTATGTEVTPDPALPAVTLVNGVPTVAPPQGDPPTELVVQPLIEGTGAEITAGQTVTMQYVGVIWASGLVFDSSWQTGSVDFSIGTGQVIAGFDEGLVGQRIGSRVMLVIPPDKGYGEEGNPSASISGTDTLVFVVDLLAAP